VNSFVVPRLISPMIHRLAGLQKEGRGNSIPSSPCLTFSIYRIDERQWVDSRIDDQGSDIGDGDGDTREQPESRYAHQVVYDPTRQTFFMFGGNNGSEDGRLSDFWKVVLIRWVELCLFFLGHMLKVLFCVCR